MDTTPDRIPGGAQTNSKRGLPTIAHAASCWVWDTEGRKYLDCVAGLGPVILGHDYPEVTAAVGGQLLAGVCYPGPSEEEAAVAETLARLIPCAEQVRFLKNGADATAAAVRLARAVTGRTHILRCGYHGWQDWCLDAPAVGVPERVRGLCHAFPYNNLSALEADILRWYPAAVILEPIVSQAPEMPIAGYLEQVWHLCDFYETLLLFDEVVTGFRLHLGGAQAYFGVTPDLAAFSKAMGNGFPIAALVGKERYMRRLGEDVFVSTTFGGDLVGLAAARATIEVLERKHVPEQLVAFGECARQLFLAKRGGTNVTLVGYPARLLERWADPIAGQRFQVAVRAAGVLALGSYNFMLAHTEQADTVLATLAAAWEAGFAAAGG